MTEGLLVFRCVSLSTTAVWVVDTLTKDFAVAMRRVDSTAVDGSFSEGVEVEGAAVDEATVEGDAEGGFATEFRALVEVETETLGAEVDTDGEAMGRWLVESGWAVVGFAVGGVVDVGLTLGIWKRDVEPT